jgi:hypothetical protein
MSVGIVNKATQFHFWEYINRISGTVYSTLYLKQEEQSDIKCNLSILFGWDLD